MTSNFGFDKVIPPPEKTAPKKLDLTNLPEPLPEITPEKERKVNKRAEDLGFASRDPAKRVGEERILRHKKKTSPKLSIYVTGPAAVINRFIIYTERSGSDSYWQAIEKLLTEAEGRIAGG
jgi:hypothetical protein